MMTSLCVFIPPWLWFLPQKRSRKKKTKHYLYKLHTYFIVYLQDCTSGRCWWWWWRRQQRSQSYRYIYANLPFVCSTFPLTPPTFIRTRTSTLPQNTLLFVMSEIKTVLLLLSKKMESADEIILRSEMLKENFVSLVL